MTSDADRAAGSWQKAEAHPREASAQAADVSPMADIAGAVAAARERGLADAPYPP